VKAFRSFSELVGDDQCIQSIGDTIVPHIAYSLFNIYGATMTIKFTHERPIAKLFSAEHFLSPAKTSPQNGGFCAKMDVLTIIFFFGLRPQKAHPCAEPRLMTYFCVKISVMTPRL